MSKRISYKGTILIGEQESISLKTNTGKTGYRIVKFNVIGVTPMKTDQTIIGQVFKTDQTGSITDNVNFTDSDLLAVATYEDTNSKELPNSNHIIFDNEKFNQDIFITATDADGNTTPMNYYLELEAMPLSDLEATFLTMQNIRQITAPSGNV